MPKQKTLKRRAQRARAKAYRNRVVEPGLLDKVDAIIKSHYVEPLRALFLNESAFLKALEGKDKQNFSGRYYTTVPYSLRENA